MRSRGRDRDVKEAGGCVIQAASVGLDAALYTPPGSGAHGGEPGRVWSVPMAGCLLDDIASAGYSLPRLVDAVCEFHGNGDKLGLTGAILARLKQEEKQDKYHEYQSIGEEAELVLIEAQLRKAALSGEDTQALKFYLERRAPSRFGRQVKQEAGDKTAEDLSNLLDALKARTGG